MRRRRWIAVVSVLAGSLLHAAPSQAQTTRTWVSGVGDDVNPCSLTAPCKTYAGAIGKTAAGGEISVWAAGGFGVVTIAKSVSLVAVGVEASVIALNATGITINAQPTDTVLIDGLVFEGGGSGLTGIRIVQAQSVHIRNCVIRGFQGSPGYAIDIAPGLATQVFVSNCAIMKNNGGIVVRPADNGSAQVFVDGVTLDNNSGAGIATQGKAAVVRLNRSAITNNGLGLDVAGGSVVSFGNNAISGNMTDGKPTEVQPLQ